MRILVYQRRGTDWVDVLEDLKAQGYVLHKQVFLRMECRYIGTERADKVYTENESIANDYRSIGIEVG